MDARPTKSASLSIFLRDALPLFANSDANARRAKINPLPWVYHTLQLFYPQAKCTTCLRLSHQTNTCLHVSNGLQVVFSPKPPLSAEVIKMERFYAMRRNARQSSSSFLNSSSYNSGGRRNPKCVMVGPAPNLGYSCGPKIFKNVEAMQAKEAATKKMMWSPRLDRPS
jgi:hypothetical protein